MVGDDLNLLCSGDNDSNRYTNQVIEFVFFENEQWMRWAYRIFKILLL